LKIIVDADACPVKNLIIEIAQQHGIPVVMVLSIAHLATFPATVEMVTVDSVPQAVDIAILNLLRPADIVVTQDIGLAAAVLGGSALALSPRGLRYDEGNIDSLLHERHLAAKTRRGGRRAKGPRPHTREDDDRFRNCLERLIGVNA
jgi:uncharacterized protein YaiI (UPF0178 family)